MQGFDKGDKIVYDAEDGTGLMTYEEVDAVIGHDADSNRPNNYFVGIGEDSIFVCLFSEWPGLSGCHIKAIDGN